MKRRAAGNQGGSASPRLRHSPTDARPVGYRPNLARQILFIVVTLAAVFGGYCLAPIVEEWLEPAAVRGSADPAETPRSGTTTKQPWYRSQPPAPTLIAAPDAPIFPEPAKEPGEGPVRPYEEALPREVYEHPTAPVVALPPPPTGSTARDQPPWRQFAAVIPPAANRPLIALVIDDMGVDKRHSDQVIHLKGPLTLSFLAYASDLARQTAAAAAAGHELLLHLSMEPSNAKLDPGPNVLTNDLGPDELRRRLDWGLSRFSNFVGINNHMGSKFTADVNGMTLVMEELKRRGLMFLDSRTTSRTIGASLAAGMGVPYAERNIFLDNVNDVAAVNARLSELEHLAERKGFAVAIGHPRKATLEALSAWLPELEKRGFVLVPLTAVVRIGGPAG